MLATAYYTFLFIYLFFETSRVNKFIWLTTLVAGISKQHGTDILARAP
jgi:hypothetical protein